MVAENTGTRTESPKKMIIGWGTVETHDAHQDHRSAQADLSL